MAHEVKRQETLCISLHLGTQLVFIQVFIFSVIFLKQTDDSKDYLPSLQLKYLSTYVTQNQSTIQDLPQILDTDGLVDTLVI